MTAQRNPNDIKGPFYSCPPGGIMFVICHSLFYSMNKKPIIEKPSTFSPDENLNRHFDENGYFMISKVF